jgi:steroid delta-isomerase-like uncharacterized protein
MSSENKNLAHRFHTDIFQNGNLEATGEILSNNFKWHGGMTPPEQGPEGVRQMANVIISAFPDRQITHHETIAEGDKVMVRWSMSGTHKGEMMGIPPTNKTVNLTGFDLFRISDGKIVEMWQDADQLGMMQQLGVVQKPE